MTVTPCPWITEVFFAVVEETTIVSGKTILLKDDLPKLGAKGDSDAQLWRMSGNGKPRFNFSGRLAVPYILALKGEV